MLASLRNFLAEQFSLETDSGADTEHHELGLATAALAMDIARADETMDDAERRHIAEAVADYFSLAGPETEKIMQLADTRLEESVSLYDFTRQLNDGLDRQERVEIVRLLWDVAWADNEIHKYEEHFIRKIADLLYVSHSDYIRAKLAAEEDRQRNGKKED
ncbi:MAG: TerB family tellurite resistance protein [Gammaproteobacteria bacterium]|nr:TerB family tellurite resistance protein [Gammaproteobacteria bacterium]